MHRTQPRYIMVVEDDMDDQQIIGEALNEIAKDCTLVFHDSTKKAFDYLLVSGKPFLIISDVNLPGQNGVDFKKRH